ncbi:MAG: extracellular solute-binding protein, partial [Candidatus Korarchaeota archaeon]|nr:extracellular solute-binding protein [Candidatus Korarchaeota archaeon]
LVLDATGVAPDSKKIFVRDKSVDLVALVEQGIIDYAFEYRNIAASHGLKYVELPPQLSLADPALDDHYSQVSVKIRGAGGSTKILAAKSITYGATIPTTARNPEAAKSFIQLLLGPKGRDLLLKAGFRPLYQPKLVVRRGASPPDWLVGLAKP